MAPLSNCPPPQDFAHWRFCHIAPPLPPIFCYRSAPGLELSIADLISILQSISDHKVELQMTKGSPPSICNRSLLILGFNDTLISFHDNSVDQKYSQNADQKAIQIHFLKFLLSPPQTKHIPQKIKILVMALVIIHRFLLPQCPCLSLRTNSVFI